MFLCAISYGILILDPILITLARLEYHRELHYPLSLPAPVTHSAQSVTQSKAAVSPISVIVRSPAAFCLTCPSVGRSLRPIGKGNCPRHCRHTCPNVCVECVKQSQQGEEGEIKQNSAHCSKRACRAALSGLLCSP